MKKLFTLLLLSVFALQTYAQEKTAKIEFESKVIDYGTIEKGADGLRVFKFTNTGDAPLIITDATSSCGCTIPDYPKNTPIAPGQQGKMVVNFNGSGQNQVTKTINVQANTANGSELLKIQAFVLAPNAASIPSN